MRERVALVLAGGAARGAYEVGVIDYVMDRVGRTLGRPIPLDVLCGTSVGALNCCVLAAFADEGDARAERLLQIWTGLSMAELVRLDPGPFAALAARLAFGPRPDGNPALRSLGLVDPTGLERLLGRTIPFSRIPSQLAEGYLDALTVSTTHVATGRTVVFVERREPGLPPWSHDPTVFPRAARITLDHAMASAALPLLFRAVALDGEYHVDGGLRQNVPLSPARRLGATRMLIVNPRYVDPIEAVHPVPRPGEHDPPPGPLVLLGKALNALLLDRIDTDVARLEGINRILEAGQRRYGDGFLHELNATLESGIGRAIRPLQALLVKASEDIAALSAAYARSAAFKKRVPGLLGKLVGRIAERAEGDVLSYLLFDGEFARILIDLGRKDAAARHDELCAFFEPAVRAAQSRGQAPPPASSISLTVLEDALEPLRESLYGAATELRFRVLREPLGMTRAEVKVEGEEGWMHLVAHDPLDPSRALGSVSLSGTPPVGRLRQMAVAFAAQGQGLGARLVRALERRAYVRGFERIELHAREGAMGFYAKLGYAAFGEPFDEVGIAHRAMGKSLP